MRHVPIGQFTDWIRPSTPGSIRANAPNVASFVTWPSPRHPVDTYRPPSTKARAGSGRNAEAQSSSFPGRPEHIDVDFVADLDNLAGCPTCPQGQLRKGARGPSAPPNRLTRRKSQMLLTRPWRCLALVQLTEKLILRAARISRIAARSDRIFSRLPSPVISRTLTDMPAGHHRGQPILQLLFTTGCSCAGRTIWQKSERSRETPSMLTIKPPLW